MHVIRDFQFFLCFLMTESRAASRLLRCCVGCGYMIKDIHVCGVELHDGSGGGVYLGDGLYNTYPTGGGRAHHINNKAGRQRLWGGWT